MSRPDRLAARAADDAVRRRPAEHAAAPAHPLASLHGAIGNRAVQRALAPDAMVQRSRPPGDEHAGKECNCSPDDTECKCNV